MKSKIIACLILALALSATQLSARVGENEQQVDARYGKPIGSMPVEGGLLKKYKSSGLVIGVVFINGASESELFSKADNSSLSDAQITMLLRANAESLDWKEQGTPVASVREWRRSDDKLKAIQQGRTFIICLTDFLQRTAKIRDQQEAAKLSNF